MRSEFPGAPRLPARTGAAFGVAHRQQQGVVLLALILVMLVGSSALLLGQLNERALDYARAAQTQAALFDAKNALIRFAVTYPETQDKPERSPGYLPCPDQDDDGSAESNCAETTGSTLGLLPTADLGIDRLTDSSGGRIWYAVSTNFKNNQVATHVLNSDTAGTLNVDGADDVVAVLIAAGEPLSAQSGRGTAATEVAAGTKDWYEVAAQYLEDGNPTPTDEAYVTAYTAGSPAECTDGSLSRDEIEKQCFNDQLITITRRELMAAVEARVANDVRAALAAYRNEAGGAFPWLAPFSDPKRGARHGASIGGYGLSGRHTSAGGSAVLTDSNADFLTAGVSDGDRIWNVTDGSYGTVGTAGVTANTLTVGGLSGGTDNDFDTDDVYYVEAAALDLAALFDGTAGISSLGTTLDAAVNLEQFGVVPGDIIENLTDGTSGSVVSVDGSTVELDSGSGVEFVPGDDYRVRSPAAGISSVGSGGLTLVDQDIDFNAADVQAGDLVRNITDGSLGLVASIVDAQTLTLSSLYGGTDNAFAACNGVTIPCDSYTLIRLTPETSTRYGLLPIHEYGKPFGSEFSVQWYLPSANGNTVSVSASGAATTYTTALTNWIQQSTLYSDSTGTDTSYPNTVTANSDVACVWTGLNIAQCSGKRLDSDFLTATVESVTLSGDIYSITDTGTRFNRAGVRQGAKIRNVTQAVGDGIVYQAISTTQNIVKAVPVDDSITGVAGAGSGGITLVDAGEDFVTMGVQAGQLVMNVSDGSQGFVETVGIPDNQTLTVASLSGGASNAFTAGDDYVLVVNSPFTVSAADKIRIWVATKRTVSNVADGATDTIANKVCKDGQDFSYVEEGDTIRLMSTTLGNPVGRITGVTGTLNECLVYTDLLGGSTDSIALGQSFRIYYDFIEERQWEMRVRMAGTATLGSGAAGMRTRTVCQGYASGGCDTLNTEALYVTDNTNPVITFSDYEIDSPPTGTTPIGTASVTIPAAGTATGSLLAGDMDLWLAEDEAGATDDGFLPRWFIRNRWHEYVFVSYADGFSPANADDCVAGECITVNAPGAAPQDNRHAVAVVAGPALASQDRATLPVVLGDYFEDDNADPETGLPSLLHSIFERADSGDTFNDQLSAVLPE